MDYQSFAFLQETISIKKALITGITGQDGAYLSELLLRKGYQVYGGMRRTSNFGKSLWRLDTLNILNRIEITEFDLLEYSNILETIKDIQPDEVYNLAAQSFVASSFRQPIVTCETNSMGFLRILDAIKSLKPSCKVYQASTSEMFGNAREAKQNENTPFHPRSPYGVAKVAAHWHAVNYRESFNIFAVSGILCNHESPLRGEEFVTRKISKAVARIQRGEIDSFEIGNLNVCRDWGFAREYVKGMYLMMQHEQPDTFVLATGEAHTVREFIETSFNVIGDEITWEGEGIDEIGISTNSGEVRVKIDLKLYRPAEVDFILGDASKAKKILGWEATTRFDRLVKLMVKADLFAKDAVL